MELDQLTPIAQAKFDEIVEYLQKHNKFQEIDKTLIEIFARAYGNYIKYSEMVEIEGSVLQSDKGNKYIHPASNIVQQNFNTMKSLTKELGIGGLARDRLGMEEPREMDEMERLIFGND